MPNLSVFRASRSKRRVDFGRRVARALPEQLRDLREAEKNLALTNPYGENLYPFLYAVYRAVPAIRSSMPKVRKVKRSIRMWAAKNPFEYKKCEFSKRNSDLLSVVLAACSRVNTKSRSRWVRALKSMPKDLSETNFKSFMKKSGGVSGLAAKAVVRKKRRVQFPRKQPAP